VIRLALLIALLATAAPATELQVQHSVVKRLVSEQVFTDDGRKYVKANRLAKCSYAYLENPDISAENGRLKIRARFTGKSGSSFFGSCLSIGDSFQASILATPYYKDGSIFLKDVVVRSEDKDSYYIRKVRTAMAQAFTQQFSYRVIDDAKRMLETPAPKSPFQQQMTYFDVKQIRVTDQAIVLVVEFTMVVK